MAAPAQNIIIIKRKKVSHGGHHGGAWKVAYADFVTAMMALFIVLWLLSSSEQVQKAVGGYFTDPNGHGKDVGNGLKGSGSESLSVNKDDMSKLKDKLEQAIKDTSTLQKIKEHVIFTVTNEGLRVELLEDAAGTFFQSGSPVPTDDGKELLAKLAEEIGKLPNRITMEGHTDSKPFSGRADYSNWELSSDRANAARRWMHEKGLRDDQVAQVRGFADQSLRNPADAEDPKNRRITVIILYARTAAAEADDKAKAEAEAKAAEEKKASEGKGGEKGKEGEKAKEGAKAKGEEKGKEGEKAKEGEKPKEGEKAKTEDRSAEGKSDAKGEAKSETKPGEAKAAAKTEGKTEGKAGAKAEGKVDGKAAEAKPSAFSFLGPLQKLFGKK